MAIPLSTTTFTVLRAPAQTDGYPDTEPTYVAVAGGVRGHISLATKVSSNDPFLREATTARFVCDPTALAAFDLLADDTTGRIWKVEWFENRPKPRQLAHLAGLVRYVEVEVSATRPTAQWWASADGSAGAEGSAGATVVVG